MSEILKTIRLFISLAIPYLIWFIPRNRKIWIYGGRNGKFVDNTKYWFIWANQNLPEIKHIWISNDETTLSLLKNNGFLGLKPFSISGLYYILRAKIFFYTHGATSIIRPIFLEGGIKFDFFHGIALKTIRLKKTQKFNQTLESGYKFNISKKLFNYYKSKYVKNDFLVIPSKLYASQFDDHTGKRLFIGYPRNIVFQYSKEELIRIINFSNKDKKFFEIIHKFDKRYIYMPTFREGTPDFINDAFPNLDELNNLMEKQNAVFLLKLHPYTKTKVDFSKYSNIVVVDNEMDVYPFLPFIDCLISDYSSISIDYYFSNQPVIFYLYDLDDFIGKSRDLDFLPQELAEESTAYNWDGLLKLIQDTEQIPLLQNQKGKLHFSSHIKPDLPQLANYIQKNIL